MDLRALAATLVFAPALAFAQEAPAPATAPAPAFAAPVETIELGTARVQLVETGASAAGYALIVRKGGVTVNTLTKKSARISRYFRLLKDEEEVVLSGICSLRTVSNSAFGVEINRRTREAYACTFKDQPEGRYALEVALPTFSESSLSFGPLGVGLPGGQSLADQQAVLKAKMLYEGAVYDADPTGFRRPGVLSSRSVEGYSVTRDGQTVGRIAFGMEGDAKTRVTIPAAEADGRLGVLFFLLSLNAMPDLYAPWTRERVMSER